MRWLEIARDVAIITAALGLIAAVGWRYIAAMERLGKRGAWTAEDTWQAKPGDVTALARAVGILPDPASQTQVYQTHRRPPACPETWDDEVGCRLERPHLCVRPVGAHSTHHCVCGSMVVEAAPTLHEQTILDPRPGWRGALPGETPGQLEPQLAYTDTTLVPYGFGAVHRGCLAARKAAAADHVCDGCGRTFVPSPARWTS